MNIEAVDQIVDACVKIQSINNYMKVLGVSVVERKQLSVLKSNFIKLLCQLGFCVFIENQPVDASAPYFYARNYSVDEHTDKNDIKICIHFIFCVNCYRFEFHLPPYAVRFKIRDVQISHAYHFRNDVIPVPSIRNKKELQIVKKSIKNIINLFSCYIVIN